MSELTADYSPAIVILSFGISFISAYVAICYCEHLRIYFTMSDAAINVRKHAAILAAISVSIGGIGIWAMHFIGMHSLSLRNSAGEEVLISFNIGLSILSLFSVLVTTYAGVVISSYDCMFSKTKQEILEMFIADARTLSMAEIKKMGVKRLLFIISTQSLGTLLLGGFVTGSGVCIMHYIGMLAMGFEGRIVWRPGIIAASVLIAVSAASAAFWILFRLLSIFPGKEYLRIASALLMAVAVTGMHYTGMDAAIFREDLSRVDYLGGAMVSSQSSYFGVIICANTILWALAMGLFGDMRKVIQERSKFLKQADEIIRRVASDDYPSRSVNMNNIQKYLSNRRPGSSIASGGGHRNSENSECRSHDYRYKPTPKKQQEEKSQSRLVAVDTHVIREGANEDLSSKVHESYLRTQPLPRESSSLMKPQAVERLGSMEEGEVVEIHNAALSSTRVHETAFASEKQKENNVTNKINSMGTSAATVLDLV